MVNKLTRGPVIVGAPVARTLFTLAIPSLCMSILFSAVFAVEAAFVARVGTRALAAVAVVFPMVMLSAMWSGGAFGGAIAGAAARASGANDDRKMDSIVTAAFCVAVLGGLVMYLVFMLSASSIFSFSTSDEAVIAAAGVYADIVIPGLILFWFLNTTSSIMRGCGDIVRPAVCWAVQLLSFILFAFFLILPHQNDTHAAMAGAAWTMNLSLLVGLFSIVIAYFQSGRRSVPRLGSFDAAITLQIFRQGLLAGTQSLMTIAYAFTATALFSRYGVEWLAAYGMAVRLELILMPLVFGIGMVLIPMCGAYLGASRRADAIRIAWFGVVVNFVIITVLGFVIALQPHWWCDSSSQGVKVGEYCQLSLNYIAPSYGIFALGLTCYIASQAFNTLKVPVIGAFLRLLIVASGFVWIGEGTEPHYLLWLIVFAVTVYGVSIAVMLYLGPWSLKKPSNNGQQRF